MVTGWSPVFLKGNDAFTSACSPSITSVLILSFPHARPLASNLARKNRDNANRATEWALRYMPTHDTFRNLRLNYFCNFCGRRFNKIDGNYGLRAKMEPTVGIEPTTHALRKRCSTN